MNQSEVFGRLFYLFPTIPPHQQEIEGEVLMVNEQLVGVLWLIDLMESQDGASCSQHTITKLFERWWPHKEAIDQAGHYGDTMFSRIVVSLTKSRLIKQKLVKRDHRKRTLALTDAGRKFLFEIQQRRLEVLSNSIEPQHLEAFFKRASGVVNRAWVKLLTELHSDGSTDPAPQQ